MKTIGVVGLGSMGGAVAGRLLATGHSVVGTNRTQAKASSLLAQGLVWCDSPRATSAASDVAVSMVTDRAALGELPEKAWFDVAMMQKDLALAVESGRAEELLMPSTTAADTVLTLARTAGYEHRDIAALLQVMSDQSVTADRAAAS